MFDRNQLIVGRAYPEHVTVNVSEKRAPTDASVKLLKEMEAAAQDKFLSHFRLEGCAVDCVVHHQVNMLMDEDHFILRYKLGEKEHRLTHIHRRRHRDAPGEQRQHLAEELVRVLGEHIAANLLAPAMAKGMPGRWPD